MKSVAGKHLKAVRAKRQAHERTAAGLRDAIYAAWLSGESYREIAPHAGMSHTQVAEQVKRARAAAEE